MGNPHAYAISLIAWARPRGRRVWAVLFSVSVVLACGDDGGPIAEQDIDGTWEVVGLFSLDVRGLVRCRLTGALDLQQLAGVNTIVGTGQHAFDCIVDGESQAFAVESTLINSRLEGPYLSMTLGSCHLLATYDRSSPDIIHDGRTYCRMSFAKTGLIDVAGTWEGYREIVP